MILLLDLGNSRLKWARWDGRELEPMQASELDAALTLPAAQRARLVSSSADAGRLSLLHDRVAAAGIEHLEVLGPPQHDALLTLAYADPATLGTDRWLAMRAGRAARSGSFVVASVGTALTVDAVDAQGHHLGGCIAPGPTAMRSVLLARAPHLGDAGGHLQLFSTRTADAVHSGPLLAAAALIERLLRGLAEHAGGTPRLLLTGGGAAALLPALSAPAELLPDLVLRGMLTLASAARGGAEGLPR